MAKAKISEKWTITGLGIEEASILGEALAGLARKWDESDDVPGELRRARLKKLQRIVAVFDAREKKRQSAAKWGH